MTPRPSNAARPDELGVTQLALALDVVCDTPTVRECADLMRELREVALGDVWQSGEYRVERDDVTGCDTVRFLRGSHVRGEWVCDTTNRLAAALRAIRDELVGTGITTGWLRRGALALEQESDDCPGEPLYNGVGDRCIREADLALPAPKQTQPALWEMGYDTGFITLKGKITVDMGIFGGQKVDGSRLCIRDPRLHFLSDRKPIPKYLRGGSRPEIIQSVPRDKDGTVMRFCSGGHYASRSEFGKNTRNQFVGKRDGLDDYCLKCRKAQRTLHRMTSARAA